MAVTPLRLYVGFDDTDRLDAPYGTGKVARGLAARMPAGCRLVGVVRQQLLVHPAVPYTSHNSAACCLVDLPGADLIPAVIAAAVAQIEAQALEGSDPGLCVAADGDPALPALTAFGRACTERLQTQGDARRACGRAHLSGHGGTRDGVIGAAAAVGLTASGWCGRYIDLEGLRDWPAVVPAGRLREAGIEVVSIERDSTVPGADDPVATNGWVRPRLMGHRPVLLVQPTVEGIWVNLHAKRRGRQGAEEPHATPGPSGPV
jgi:hypothetical protein